MEDNYNLHGGETTSFFSHMVDLTQKDKNELLNVAQYIVLAIVPILIVIKLMRMYLPSFDEEKGSIEIGIEVVLQLVLLLVFFWFIHRFIVFIPTYSAENYSSLNVFHFILPFIFILFTLETTISKKVHLLMKRLLVYVGLEKETMQVQSDSEIYTPPSIQVPCPGPMNNPYPQNTQEETSGKNYNQMYEKTTQKMVGASHSFPDHGPMAANEALGLSAF